MEELELLYKELQERQKYLESRKKTKTTEGRIAENILTMVRVQQLLIPLVVGRSEQLVAFLKWVGDGYDFENNAERIVKEYIDGGN